MASYNEPSFQQRTALAAKAKEAALAKLRAKPPVDEAVLAAKREAAAAREAAQVKASQERAAARLAEKAAKKENKAQVVVQDDAALKAARDAKYAARKNRVGRR
jgi:Family of unknown function (DUF6481)